MDFFIRDYYAGNPTPHPLCETTKMAWQWNSFAWVWLKKYHYVQITSVSYINIEKLI